MRAGFLSIGGMWHPAFRVNRLWAPVTNIFSAFLLSSPCLLGRRFKKPRLTSCTLCPHSPHPLLRQNVDPSQPSSCSWVPPLKLEVSPSHSRFVKEDSDPVCPLWVKVKHHLLCLPAQGSLGGPFEDSIITLWLLRSNHAPPPPQSNMVEQGPQNDSSSMQTHLLTSVLWQLLQRLLTGLEGRWQLQRGPLPHAPGGKVHGTHSRLFSVAATFPNSPSFSSL